jgi:hypothetical protein
MVRATVFVSGLMALAVALGAQAQGSPTAPRLTAAQIVDKNVAARGGLQAWRSVQTLSMSGKMDAGGNNQPTITRTGITRKAPRLTETSEQVQLPFRMELERGRKSRLELDFAGQTAVQVYDGTNGWKLRPYLNRQEVEPYTPDELRAAAFQSDLDGPLVDYGAKGTKVELEGTDSIEGRNAYRLKLGLKDGQSRHLWVDAQSFLETKLEGIPRRLNGKMHPVEVYYRDYRTVDGLKMPFLVETRVQGVAQSEKIAIEKIMVNPKLDDQRFAKLK